MSVTEMLGSVTIEMIVFAFAVGQPVVPMFWSTSASSCACEIFVGFVPGILMTPFATPALTPYSLIDVVQYVLVSIHDVNFCTSAPICSSPAQTAVQISGAGI